MNDILNIPAIAVLTQIIAWTRIAYLVHSNDFGCRLAIMHQPNMANGAKDMRAPVAILKSDNSDAEVGWVITTK